MLSKEPSQEIIVLGAGGHAHSIIDAIERSGQFHIRGLIAPKDDTGYRKYAILGSDEDLNILFEQGISYAAMGIGYMGNSNLRKKIYDKCLAIGFSFPSIVDPSAVVSDAAVIQDGAFVGKGAIVNAGAKIGTLSIINTGAIIEHDTRIGDFSHIAPGATVCGDVNVFTHVFIGAGSTVIQGLEIGDNVLVGAGSVVVKDIAPDDIVYGNPAIHMEKDK